MRHTLRSLLPVLFVLACVPAFGQTTISNLPAATLPLGGTELVPLVQSGITKNAPASAFGSGGGGGCTMANPTATIGATAVNGTATTCMRSDAAPALPSTLPALNGSALTSLNASNIASGTVPSANLPTATTGALGAVKVDGSSITITSGIISATTGGSGTVSTTGSPASGNLSKFSGTLTITNGDLSGDCTTSGTLAITCTKTSGSAFGTGATQNTGTSGATLPFLNGTNTWSGVQSINSSDLSLKGSSSGSTVVNATAVASGTLTLPAATDTLVGRATTDTLTNKSIAGSEINSGAVAVANGGTACTAAAVGCVTAITGATGTPSSTTYLRGDGTWSTPAGSGTVTSVATNNGVTGGTITTTGTIGLATIAADNLLANSTGSTAVPIATSIGSCSAAASALTYNTSTHVFGCNTISGSGTVNSGTSGQMAYYASSTNAVSGNANATISTGALTLGGSAVQGSVVLNGSTSGTTTVVPTAAAGATTATLPANTGTVAELNLAQTWTAVQSITSSDLSLKGSSSGATVLNATAAAGSTTATLPANTGTIAELNLQQNWTALQSNCVTTLTISTTTFTPDGTCNNYKLTLTGSDTIANWSSTMVAGTSGIIEVVQDATGSRTASWGTQYVAAGGVASITLSTAANAQDFISFFVIDSTHILISAGALNASH